MSALSWILVVLLVASIVCCAIVCNKYASLKNRIVKVSDAKPKGKTANAKMMKLSNELADYIIEGEDEISLYVLKK